MATRPWVPTDLVTLVLEGWYFTRDAQGALADGANVVQSGGLATQWNDASGKNRPLIPPTTAARMAYSANGLATGVPGLTSTGAQFMRAAISTSGAPSIFMVAKLAASNTLGKRIISLASTGNNDNSGGGLQVMYCGGGAQFTYAQGNQPGPYSTIGNDTPGLMESVALSSTAGATRANAGSSTATRTIATGSALNIFSLFNNTVATGDNVTGSVSELVFVTGVLSNSAALAEAQQLEGYLLWNAGLQANLPANHPYKAAAPTVDDGAGVVRRRRSMMLIAS